MSATALQGSSRSGGASALKLRLITCACGHPAMRPTGEINRALKRGWPLWCSRECAGLARRKERSEAELKAAKAAYDRRRRTELAEQLRAAKREYHKRTYDPAKAAEERRRKMPRHVEYCRRPEYRAKKADYDKRRLAQQQFGDLWESQLLVLELETEILSRASRYEIDLQNGKLNKATRRKREYEQSVRG